MNLRFSNALRLVILGSAIATLVPDSAATAWQANGVPVAPDLGPWQDEAQICPDGAGGAYIIFLEYSADDRADTYVQRITAAGDIAPGWPSTALPLGVTPRTEWPHRLTPDLLGGVFVVWSTNENPQGDTHRLQRVLPDGTIAPGWPADGLRLPFRVFASGVCPDGQGGALLVWTIDERLVMLHYTADGQLAPGWSETPRRMNTTEAYQGLAQVIPQAGGGCFVIWVEQRSGYKILATKLLGTGEPDPGWPATGTVVASIPSGANSTFSAPDGTGGLFVAWSDYRNGPFCCDGYFYEVYGQHVLGSATVDPLWPTNGIPLLLGASQYTFQMVSDGAGGMNFVSSGRGVVAVRIRSDGTVAPGWTPNAAPVATTTQGHYAYPPPPAVSSGDGGVYTFWSDEFSFSILGQQLGPNGSPAPGWGTSGTLIATGGGNYAPQAISDGANGAIVVYERTTAGTSRRIFAHRVRADGPVPIRISFLDFQVGPGTAHLRWAASDAPMVQAFVHRRQGDEPWTEVGTATSTGESVLQFEDRDLPPGRYGYRLRVIENGTESLTEEVMLDVPSAFALSLVGFEPNPAVGAVSIAFTLASDDPATITVHDVRGRLVASRVVSSLGPGRHRVDLSGAARFAPGVYWVRMTQAGRLLQSRGVVLR